MALFLMPYVLCIMQESVLRPQAREKPNLNLDPQADIGALTPSAD